MGYSLSMVQLHSILVRQCSTLELVHSKLELEHSTCEFLLCSNEPELFGNDLCNG